MAPWLVLLVAAGVSRFVAAYIRRYVGGRVGLDVQYDLRNAIYEHLHRLDFARHDELQTGQLVSRAITDLASSRACSASCRSCSATSCCSSLSLVVMLILSPLLTLVALLAVARAADRVASGCATSIFPASWDAQQQAGEVAGVVDEAVTGVRVVKGFGQEDRELGHLADAGRRPVPRRGCATDPAAGPVPRRRCRRSPRSARSRCSPSAAGWPPAATSRLGTFLAFSTYLVQLVAPVRMLAGLVAVGQQARAGAERDPRAPRRQPRRSPSGPTPHDARRRRAATSSSTTCASATLQHRAGARRLRRCAVAPGETVALVGASRLGQVDRRPAAAPLLRRAATARSRIDGIDVRDVTLDSLRRQVGVVFEDAFLFSDTVRANIAYGRPDATDEEVAARRRAPPRPTGSSPSCPTATTPSSASAASRSRAASASASPWPARSSPTPGILVLDDATSVGRRARPRRRSTPRCAQLMAGRTTILIAHRRSTLRLADRIVVLDDGRVVDDGTHEELLGALRPVPRAARRPGRRRRRRRVDDRERATGATARREARHGITPSATGTTRTTSPSCPTRPAAHRRRRRHRRRVAAGRGGMVAASPPRPSCWPQSTRCPRPTTTPTSTCARPRPTPDGVASGCAVRCAAWRALAGGRPRPGRRRRRAHAARPVPRAARHRPRRHRRRDLARCCGRLAAFALGRRSPTGSSRGRYTLVTGRTGRAAAVRPAGEDLRPPPAARRSTTTTARSTGGS